MITQKLIFTLTIISYICDMGNNEKMVAEFDRINKEVKYMLIQKKNAEGAGQECSADFLFWLGEKIKYLKELGKKLNYNI